MSAETQALRKVFDRLRSFKVTRWTANSSSNDHTPDRKEVDTAAADVVSSHLRYTKGAKDGGRHLLVLDIDHQAWLLKSSTPGHFHLIVEVPGGIPWVQYGAMMLAMAKAGVLEDGYVRASIARGYSAVRLPWVKKPAAPAAPPVTVAADFAAIEQRVIAAQKAFTDGMAFGDQLVHQVDENGDIIATHKDVRVTKHYHTAAGNDISTLAGALADAMPKEPFKFDFPLGLQPQVSGNPRPGTAEEWDEDPEL